MISGDYVEIWPDGERLRQPRLPQGWSYTKAASHVEHWCNPPSCVLLRKDVFDRVGGFDPQQRCAEDNDLWRRVSWCHRIHHVEEPLLRYRCGHTSLMRNARRMLIYEMRHYIKMRLDTPSNLRSALPALRYIAAKLWRFLRWYTPVWLRQPRKQWIALRQRLNFTSW
jgi:GT2 family glycosyltransferase